METESGVIAGMMKECTKDLHTQAERSGVIRYLLNGSITTEAYVLYLRNLAAIYDAMECVLKTKSPILIDPLLYRSTALQSDLCALAGGDWAQEQMLLESANLYRERIETLSDAPELIAHIYVRYLGDLNGGQVLAKLLSRNLGFEAGQLSFYRFDERNSLAQYKSHLRNTINDYGSKVSTDTQNSILRESQRAFSFNIDLSRQVEQETS